MPFEFTSLAIPGVVLIKPRIYSDDRGYFAETYKQNDYTGAGLAGPFVQENQSRSVRGTLRGLHFQRAPMAQAKLVRVLAGEIFDVAVDLRPDAPTFGRWVGVRLAADTLEAMFIPPWCAHGFCVLSEYADVLYKTSAEYAPHLESGIAWDDPALGISWPITDPILSDRDRSWPCLKEVVEA